MKNKIKNFFAKEKEAFNANKWKYLFSLFIYLEIMLLLFMLPGLSYTQYHKIPLLFAGVMAVSIIVYVLIYHKFFLDKYILLLFSFCLVIIFSSLINDPTKIGQTEFLLVGLFFALYQFMARKEYKERAIISMFAGLVLFAFYFLIVYRKEILSLDFGRLGRQFGNENSIGHYLMLGYILTLYISITKKRYPLIVFLPIFALLGALTGSKLFFIMLVLVTVAFIILFFGKKKWHWSAILIAVGFGVAIGLLQLPMFATLKQRLIDFLGFFGVKNNTIDESSITRLNMFFEGLYLFSFKPLFGWGSSGFTIYAAYDTYSHSTFSELLCNFGLIGFLAFTLPILMGIFNKKNKDKDEFALKMLLTIFIFCLFIFSMSYSSKVFYVALAIFCAVNNCYVEDGTEKKLYYQK